VKRKEEKYTINQGSASYMQTLWLFLKRAVEYMAETEDMPNLASRIGVAINVFKIKCMINKGKWEMT
jgi:hypothetical protein